MTEDARGLRAQSARTACGAARARRGHARGVRDPAVPLVDRIPNWRVSRAFAVAARAPAVLRRLRRAAEHAPPADQDAGAQHLQLGRLHRPSHHRRIRARHSHQGRLSDVRFERNIGGEPAGRPLRLRHREHHHGLSTAARYRRAPTCRSTSAKLPNWKNLDPGVLAAASAGRSGQPLCGSLPACDERLRVQRGHDQGAHARRAARTARACCSIPKWSRNLPTAE